MLDLDLAPLLGALLDFSNFKLYGIQDANGFEPALSL
jgi:hypothetical protein